MGADALGWCVETGLGGGGWSLCRICFVHAVVLLRRLQRIRRFLAERSRPWAMLDIGKPFPTLLRALPHGCRVLVLEVRAVSGHLRTLPAVPVVFLPPL